MRKMCTILLPFTLRRVTSIEALFTDLTRVLVINGKAAKKAQLNVFVEVISCVTKYVA